MTEGPVAPLRISCWRIMCSQAKPCAACMKALARALSADHIAWFERTGHCGGCGQPGDWCQCHDKAPCGCRELHLMGAGIGRDPVEVFADVAPAAIEQEGLFG